MNRRELLLATLAPFAVPLRGILPTRPARPCPNCRKAPSRELVAQPRTVIGGTDRPEIRVHHTLHPHVCWDCEAAFMRLEVFRAEELLRELQERCVPGIRVHFLHYHAPTGTANASLSPGAPLQIYRPDS